MKIILALVLFLALTPSAIAESLFPASYSIKVVTKDYHLNMRPLSDKAVMRVTTDFMVDIISKKELFKYFREIEIIDNNQLIYQDGGIEDYTDPSFVKLADCEILKGKAIDYFAYSFDSSVGSPEHTIRYQVLRIIKENSKYKVI